MDSSLSVDFPPLVSAYMKKVLARLEAAEGKQAQEWHRALARQLLPSQEEELILPCELADPLGAIIRLRSEWCISTKIVCWC